MSVIHQDNPLVVSGACMFKLTPPSCDECLAEAWERMTFGGVGSPRLSDAPWGHDRTKALCYGWDVDVAG